MSYKVTSKSNHGDSTSKNMCLLVVSSAPQGVSAQSFTQAFNVLHQAQIQMQLASPSGQPCEFVGTDDSNRKWIAEFRSKSYSQPISLKTVDASRYNSLVIPHSPGALHDLAKDSSLGDIINSFLRNNKLIVAIGQGCAALCSARAENMKWSFQNRCITAMSVYELAKQEDFSSMSVIVEDFARDNGAYFSAQPSGGRHIVVDNNVITAQNEESTLIAVQNLVLQSTSLRPRSAAR